MRHPLRSWRLWRMRRAIRRMTGVTYPWGGTSTAPFDCSGLLEHVRREVGE